MARRLLLGLTILLTGAGALALPASAATVTLGWDAGAAAHAVPYPAQELKGMLANCCENPDGSGSSGPNAGTDNIGFGNTGTDNIGIGNGGSHNIGALNGRGNASPTSGNFNLGIENGNGNASAYSGNRNVGAFNGNLNGIGSTRGTSRYNGNGNVGAYNGNLNGVANIGADSGSFNGNDNVGRFNGNRNGSGNVGAFNGNGNGNGNVGVDNGNANGNDNVGAYNGNGNGNDNRGIGIGNRNGSNNLGAYNGNWNGDGNVDGSETRAATLTHGATATVAEPASSTLLTPDPVASDGEAVDSGAFERSYTFTLNGARDLEYGGIAVGIFDFDIDLCAAPACQGSDIIDSGDTVHGLLSVAGGWESDLGAGTYTLLVSGFAAHGGGAYLVGIIATPVAATPLPASAFMLLTGLAALVGISIGRRRASSVTAR